MSQDIKLLDLEWRLIEPKIRQQVEAETALTAYVSIIAARAGVDGTAYVLDCAKRALVPTYTKEQLDEKLAQKIDQSVVDALTGGTHGDQ